MYKWFKILSYEKNVSCKEEYMNKLKNIKWLKLIECIILVFAIANIFTPFNITISCISEVTKLKNE